MVTYPNAKLNIGLNVLRRRPDGYHDLESLFVPCPALKDELEIVESGRFGIDIFRGGRLMDGSLPGDWNPSEDLVAKAYRLLRKDFQLPPVRIRLEKHIPVGAGLGGGSSDAAFALRMLSEMFDLYIPDTMLEIYAAELGSDCPFFIGNAPAFASGRGEMLEPLDIPALEEYRIEVVVPPVSVSTREAYAGIVPGLPSVPLREALSMPVEKWKDGVVNDFEKSVFAAHPSIAEAKKEMYARGAVYASMSGSGSAVFGLLHI